MSKFTKMLLVILGVTFYAQCAYAGLAPGKSQLKAYTWFRYTAKAEGELTELDASYFGLERGYLRWEHAFTDKISCRVNVDIFSSDKDPHGAGLKLKYGYVDFKGIIPEGKITVGLQKIYWGTVYDWKYVTIEKTLEDKEKVVASADYGVTANADIPRGMGEWQLGVYNGEGYKKYKSNVDKYPALIGNVRFIPIPGLTIGGSALYEKKEESKRLLVAGICRVARGPIDFWSELIMTKTGEPELTGLGVMIMPILKLNPNLELVGRVDYWDRNTDEEKDAHYRIIGGFNYYIVKLSKGKPGVMLQVNFERKKYEDSNKEADNEFLMQLRWEFATNPF